MPSVGMIHPRVPGSVTTPSLQAEELLKCKNCADVHRSTEAGRKGNAILTPSLSSSVIKYELQTLAKLTSH